MKRTLLAAVLALVVHGLLLETDFSWLPTKKPMRSKPLPVTVTLSYLHFEKPEPEPVVQKQRLIPEKRLPVVDPETIPPKPATPPKKKPKRIAPIKEILKKPVTQKKKPLPPKPSMPLEKQKPMEKPKVRPPKTPPPPVMETRLDRKPEDPSASQPTKSSGETVRTLQEIKPIYRSNPPPKYPRMARRKKYQGVVILDVLVNQNGGVGDIRIFRSSGYSILDKAAINAVKGWLFEPGKRGDMPVDMRVTVPVHFRLR